MLSCSLFVSPVMVCLCPRVQSDLLPHCSVFGVCNSDRFCICMALTPRLSGLCDHPEYLAHECDSFLLFLSGCRDTSLRCIGCCHCHLLYQPFVAVLPLLSFGCSVLACAHRLTWPFQHKKNRSWSRGLAVWKQEHRPKTALFDNNTTTYCNVKWCLGYSDIFF
jgi:hypothetical protein